MSKLILADVRKTYKSGEVVQALKGVSLEFRESEFVAILGPSGCGKTTLLNIVGGLDRYDSGDLILSGMSTKKFRDSDWDAYRNHSIGFVFQNYNLIGHQTVLQNVEIAMTLSGVSKSERKRRAKEALSSVGLSDQMKKKPNQLSGGQMQRVAIARALVNNPDIILADEPTGALDSQTSVQVMEILKEIAKTRLVIMVTHNTELADTYSNRIIRLLDGEVQSDSNPVAAAEGTKQPDKAESKGKRKRKKTSMSLPSATALSFKNLLTKKGRTITTSFAGSIGIIGVALVFALSNGLTAYIDKMQMETLSGFPVIISKTPVSIVSIEGGAFQSEEDAFTEYPEKSIVYSYDRAKNTKEHTNVFSEEYLDYIADVERVLPDAINAISYSRGVNINLLSNAGENVVKYDTFSFGSGAFASMMGGGSMFWQEMPNNEDFILSLYDLIGDDSRLPTAENEVAIVVDEYNRIDKAFFEKLGIYTDAESYDLADFIGLTALKVIPNDGYYTQAEDGLFTAATPSGYSDLYENAEGIELTITGILRIKESAAATGGYLSQGLVYTEALTDYIVENAKNSEIAKAQKNSDTDVIMNTPFAKDEDKEQMLLRLGADTTPTDISIYPKDFEGKDAITAYLDDYNAEKSEAEQVVYTDMAEMVSSMTKTLINTVSAVLIAFAAVSLIVSTIMIGIITYVSVLERTKEIGILRSVGARKRDISNVFVTETLIIGFAAGAMGVLLAYLLTVPVNSVVYALVGIEGIASLKVVHAAALVLGSMALTLIAGLMPSRKAARKDPVVALRTE